MHPFLASKKEKVSISLLTLLAVTNQWILLYLYVDMPFNVITADSLFSVFLFACLGYLLWYMVDVTRAPLLEALVAFLTLGLWLSLSFASLYFFDYADGQIDHYFIRTLPVRVLLGILCWVILLQWYRLCKLKDVNDSIEVNCQTTTEPSGLPDNEEPKESLQKLEITDHIAVKSGTRIHIVRLDELLYLQAEGDYVMLFSASGQYLKEQTMKYFEMCLPPHRFVRIHRSYIINVEQILRVELYGKESYHVLLKNGKCLRASSAGYKLLKDRLSL